MLSSSGAREDSPTTQGATATFARTPMKRSSTQIVAFSVAGSARRPPVRCGGRLARQTVLGGPLALLVLLFGGIAVFGCDDARYGTARSIEPSDASVLDAEVLADGAADTAADTAVDEGGSGGNVRFVMTNAGDLPVYLAPVLRADSWFGVSVHDADGRQVVMEIPCAQRCDACQEVACEPPERRVRQLLPGESLTLDWNGAWAVESACGVPGREVRCVEYRRPPVGQYEARFCFSTLLDVGSDVARRRRDDTIAPAQMGPPTCVVKQFDLRERGARVSAELVGEPVDKEFGYCGQAWEYDRRTVPEFSTEIPPAREGSSVAIPVGLAEPVPCAEWGLMSAATRERSVDLRAAIWRGTQTCRAEPYVYLLDPLGGGTWTAVLTTLADIMPDPQPFQVDSCTDCEDCEAPESVGLGGVCDGDCACADGARCVAGTCVLFCRSNRDCRPDTQCSPGRVGEPVDGARRCRAGEVDECAQTSECAPGLFCQGDANLPSRCLPDLDKRLLTGGPGSGFHCGCDAECPGAQSCVRFDVNFTRGFCALRCADQRDCPKNWTCLGETSSGLESVCVR